MTHEASIAFQYLYTILSGDSQLTGFVPGGIWRGYVPPETTPPYVVFAMQSGTDSVTMNGFRMLVDGLFQVKAIGPASETQTIVNAASRIDALIGSPPTSGTTPNGAILASYRQSPLSLSELINGEVWETMGGLYRLIIESY